MLKVTTDYKFLLAFDIICTLRTAGSDLFEQKREKAPKRHDFVSPEPLLLESSLTPVYDRNLRGILMLISLTYVLRTKKHGAVV